MSVDEETLRGPDPPAPVDDPKWTDDRMARLHRDEEPVRLSIESLRRSGEWVASDVWTTLPEAR